MKAIIAILGCFATSLFVGAGTVLSNQGFGARDLRAFAFWTSIYAVFAGLIASILTRVIRKRSFGVVSLGVIVGAAMGVAWTLIAGLLLGPWFASFSFPILPSWVMGGIASVLLATNRRPEAKREFWVTICLIIVLSSAAVFAGPTIAKWNGEQKVHLIFAKWQPGAAPLRFTDSTPDFNLTEQEKSLLRQAGIGGQIDVTGSFMDGSGDESRVVVVMAHQVAETIRLPQPKRANVIYVQRERGWESLPPDAPTLSRYIVVEISNLSPRDTQVSLELVGGSRAGTLAFEW